MSTATAINYDSLTTQECKDAIDRILKSNITAEDKWLIANEDIRIAQYAVMNNIQLRDYLLSAPFSHSLSRCITAIEKIVDACKDMELETYPFETILAQFLFERGEQSKAIVMLIAGTSREYSLARLLSRVMMSGANPSIFIAMRKELHPKVVENLIEDADKVANEANRG
jgi:hypothetical protein